jgi:hypothetical protein
MGDGATSAQGGIMRRVVDWQDGVAMVLTDLHGVGDVYFRLRDQFLVAYGRGDVQRLVICGDLIHTTDGALPDDSLQMILDVMRLRAEFGADAVMLLLGNHELPHIYSLELARGDVEFTPRFEAALTDLDQQHSVYKRDDVLRFLRSLPFYARTAAGVTLSHAGAPPLASQDPAQLQRLLMFDHDMQIAAADDKLRLYDPQRLHLIFSLQSGGRPYDSLVRHYLAVTGEDDPRYNHLLRQMALDKNGDFKLLWDALFARNELDAGLVVYEKTCAAFLDGLSADYAQQRVLVAGHIPPHENGYVLVGEHHLRLATYAHAQPPQRGQYLLLDCAKPVQRAADLVPQLRLTLG